MQSHCLEAAGYLFASLNLVLVLAACNDNDAPLPSAPTSPSSQPAMTSPPARLAAIDLPYGELRERRVYTRSWAVAGTGDPLVYPRYPAHFTLYPDGVVGDWYNTRFEGEGDYVRDPYFRVHIQLAFREPNRGVFRVEPMDPMGPSQWWSVPFGFEYGRIGRMRAFFGRYQ